MISTKESNTTPIFWYESKPKEPGDYYCGVGSQHIMYRELVEKHYLYCIYAGLQISGVNAEVAPNQWEFQIGPCIGIDAGDQMWVARYILHKLSEQYDINISFSFLLNNNIVMMITEAIIFLLLYINLKAPLIFTDIM